MANLDLIKSLNEHYGKRSPIVEKTKLFAINEALDPDNIKKVIRNSIADLGPQFTKYFDLGLDANVALLFIDVCGFSTRYGGLNGKEIGEYFDKYYDIIIPIIYKHGGEIDKIMGDGIICIFGPPFLNSNDLKANIKLADNCAKEIITVTRKTNFSSKVAFHSGSINYFKNKTGLYKEFTIIGRPVTELFRLESISQGETINYYGGTVIREYYESIFSPASEKFRDSKWRHSSNRIQNIKGVSFEEFFSIKCNL